MSSWCHDIGRHRRRLSVFRAFRLLAAAAFAGALWSVPAAEAAYWSARPRVETEIAFDDNLRFTPDRDRALEAWMFDVEVAADLELETPVQSWRLRPRYRSLTFDNGPDIPDRDDRFVDISWTRRHERGEWEMGAGYARSLALDRQALESGVVDVRTPRAERNLSWSGVFEMTPKVNVVSSAMLVDVEYDDPDSTLSDFEQRAVSLGLLRAVTPRLALGATASSSRVEIPETLTRSNTRSLSATMNYELGPVLSLKGGAGVRETEFSEVFFGFPLVDEQRGVVARLSLTGETRNGSWQVRGSRDVVPSGLGQVQERTDLAVGGRYQMGPRWTWDGGILGARFDEVSEIADDVSRDFVQVRTGVSWHWSPRWRLAMNYRYQWQRLESREEASRSSRVNLAVAYEPDPWTWSR